MTRDDKTTRIVLDERDLPTHWYDVVPDLPKPLLDRSQLTIYW
jgi:predicted alternative tryptophan synthase beta-subunit